MRPLSIAYVVLALLTLATTWYAYTWINTDIMTYAKDNHYYDYLADRGEPVLGRSPEQFGMLGHPGDNLVMEQTVAVALASFFGVAFALTVLCGEAYQRYCVRFKKVPMQSIPPSNVYLLMMLFTASAVIAVIYYSVKGETLSGFYQNSETAISTLLVWTMVFAGAFVVNTVTGEICLYLRRSRGRTSNADEGQKAQEEAATA